jgi:hypothetical protein
MTEDKLGIAAITTHVEFARSVDRDILQQIAILNLQGLQALIEASQTNPHERPSGVTRLDTLVGQSEPWSKVSQAPFLLFEWRALEDWSENDEEDWQVHEPLGIWRKAEVWRRFARLATHLTAEICRHRQVAARLLLGMPQPQCTRWAALSLPEIDRHAQQASYQIDLRWRDDGFWQRRVKAAMNEGDESALWRNTLEGIQRLAVLGRSNR